MNKKLKISSLSLTIALLASCASTTIYPGEDGKLSLISTSSSESFAQKEAKKKALEYCSKQNKELIVMSHKSSYQGMDKNAKAIANLAGALLVNDTYAGSSPDDYKVEIKFRCK